MRSDPQAIADPQGDQPRRKAVVIVIGDLGAGERQIGTVFAWRRRRYSLPGLLFHDLRRSAVREMDRAGVKQLVALKITGHKTPSMWHRYRITSTEEVAEALALTQTAIRAQQVQVSNVGPLRSGSDGGKA